MKTLMWSLVLLPALSASAGTVTILSQTKTGSTSEETTYVDSGKWAGRVAFLDANEVLVTGAEAEGGSVKGKGLCKDIAGSGNAYGHLKCPRKATQVAFAFATSLGWNPRGLAFIPGANEFVVNDYERLANGSANYPLLFVDEDGAPLRTVQVQHHAGFINSHVEGLDFIPPSVPGEAGRLAMIAFAAVGSSVEYAAANIAIVRLDGVVERYIPLHDAAFQYGAAGIAVLGSDRFLVAPYTGNLYEVDLAGQVVAGPFPVQEAASLEAVDFYPDGRLFAADYGYGKAWTFDASYQRLPEEDLTFGPALALAHPVSVMEDPASDDLLIYAFPEAVYRVRRDLSAKTLLVPVRETPAGLGSSWVDVIPEDGRLVVTHSNFWTGSETWYRAISYISAPYGVDDFSVGFRPPFLPAGRISKTDYIPGTRELFVRQGSTATVDNRSRVSVFTPEGQYLREFQLPFVAYAHTFMAPTPSAPQGTLLLVGGTQVQVVSLDGQQVLETHDLPAGVRLGDVVQDATDPSGRTFFGVDDENSRVLRFQLP